MILYLYILQMITKQLCLVHSHKLVFLMMRAFKIYSIGDLQVYSGVTMLYIIFP